MSGVTVWAKISRPFCAAQSRERQRGFNHTMKYNLHQWVSASGCWYKHEKWKFGFTNLKLFKLPSPLAFHSIFWQMPGSWIVCPEALKIYKMPDRQRHLWHLCPERKKIYAFYIGDPKLLFFSFFFLCRFVFYFTLFQQYYRPGSLFLNGTFIKK